MTTQFSLKGIKEPLKSELAKELPRLMKADATERLYIISDAIGRIKGLARTYPFQLK